MKTSIIVLMLVSAGTVAAADWYPSRWGADDSLGAINHLSPEKVLEAVKLVKTGRTYSLGVPTGSNTPAYPPRIYSLTVLAPGNGTGATLGENKATYNDDILYTWMGIGSQIDGLGHLGENHVYYNGAKAEDFVAPTGLTRFGTDRIPPIVTRGVMLDMARHFGEEMLAEGTVFNQQQIDAAANAQGVTIGKGDVVLFHTGWQNLASVDDTRFMNGEPGLGVGGARYLAELGVVAVGADTWAVEVIPHENPALAFPVHVELLARNGVYLLENMDSRALAADGVYEFLFVLGQPKFVGAVQAVINPIAIQ